MEDESQVKYKFGTQTFSFYNLERKKESERSTNPETFLLEELRKETLALLRDCDNQKRKIALENELWVLDGILQ